jgi:hypothetical protein
VKRFEVLFRKDISIIFPFEYQLIGFSNLNKKLLFKKD